MIGLRTENIKTRIWQKNECSVDLKRFKVCIIVHLSGKRFNDLFKRLSVE